MLEPRLQMDPTRRDFRNGSRPEPPGGEENPAAPTISDVKDKR
jgi:hypothetical protein